MAIETAIDSMTRTYTSVLVHNKVSWTTIHTQIYEKAGLKEDSQYRPAYWEMMAVTVMDTRTKQY